MKRKIESQLLAWKERGGMPLILGGARQIGKTYILREFGHEHYKNVVYLNLETNQKMVEYFQDSIVPERLLRYMGALTGERIFPGETLIILDEIQACERALTSLKYFCEQMPEYHIAASGSLLGVAVNRQNYSFPVGKVESLMLHPFDFEEYLWARGQEELSQAIRAAAENCQPLEEDLHQKAMSYYREYLVVGGMPASINRFLQTERLEDAAVVQSEILENYIADMAKYASAGETVQIRSCYRSIPAQLAASRGGWLRKAKAPASQQAGSIEWLKFAGIVLESRRVQQVQEPLEAQTLAGENRLYFSDVGLLTARAGMSCQSVLQGGGSFLPVLTENYLAQQLAAQGSPLYFWQNLRQTGADFVLQRNGKLTGVLLPRPERQMQRLEKQFARRNPGAQLCCLTTENFAQSENVRQLPLYAAFCL